MTMELDDYIAGGNQYIIKDNENWGCLITRLKSEYGSQRFLLAGYKETLFSRKLSQIRSQILTTKVEEL